MSWVIQECFKEMLVEALEITILTNNPPPDPPPNPPQVSNLSGAAASLLQASRPAGEKFNVAFQYS